MSGQTGRLSQLVGYAARGTLMGNRGCLHDDQRRVVKSSARDAWVTCRVQWKGIRRTVMTPGKYTELFFVDEATSLAAGHRPCNECRSERLRAFKAAGLKGVAGRARDGGVASWSTDLVAASLRPRQPAPALARRAQYHLPAEPPGRRVRQLGDGEHFLVDEDRARQPAGECHLGRSASSIGPMCL